MFSGKVWKYGDDINTDLIYPGRYTYVLLTEEQMGQHALEDLDSDYLEHGMPGDILVAGKNWGCGSAREQAVKALKARGVAAVIAKSFARIYFRNCLNEGLPAIVCPEAVDAIQNGQKVTIDLEHHQIKTEDSAYSFGEYHPYIQRMVKAGGLLPFVQAELKEQGRL